MQLRVQKPTKFLIPKMLRSNKTLSSCCKTVTQIPAILQHNKRYPRSPQVVPFHVGKLWFANPTHGPASKKTQTLSRQATNPSAPPLNLSRPLLIASDHAISEHPAIVPRLNLFTLTKTFQQSRPWAHLHMTWSCRCRANRAMAPGSNEPADTNSRHPFEAVRSGSPFTRTVETGCPKASTST